MDVANSRRVKLGSVTSIAATLMLALGLVATPAAADDGVRQAVAGQQNEILAGKELSGPHISMEVCNDARIEMQLLGAKTFDCNGAGAVGYYFEYSFL